MIYSGMYSPAEPRNSSYDVTKVSDLKPTVMNRIRERADHLRDLLSTKCCSCVASVPSFALILLSLVIVTLLIAALPLAFAITYWNPQSLQSVMITTKHSMTRLHNNFNTVKIAAPLPKPTFRDYFPSNISSCRGFGFACTSDPSRVIGTNFRCDGNGDCLDNSDEMDCHECQSSVSCKKSGRLTCLRGAHLCNGRVDCDDGFDEKEYCRDACTEDEYKCANASMCILKEWLCDGDVSCPAKDDETGCKTCRGGAKMCKSSGVCLSKWMLCNGVTDCADGSDELDCDCRACSSDGTVLCDGDRKMCVSIANICDGVVQCPNGEDEAECAGSCQSSKRATVEVTLTPTLASSGNTTADVDRGTATTMMKCSVENERLFDWRYVCDGAAVSQTDVPDGCDVLCTTCYTPLAFDCFHNKSAVLAIGSPMINANNNMTISRCISRQKVCDGVVDCANGADEFDCGCPHFSLISCNDLNKQKCYKPSQKCDGAFDCASQVDERNCDNCQPGAFHCTADRKCIPDRSVCDGIVDCSDEADEIDCSCEQCSRHPFEMYYCLEGKRCFRQSDVCTPYTRCPKATQRDKMFCAVRDRNALLLF